MKSRLHIFCGKIGAGKSTLAQRLAAETGAILMVEDQWMAILYPEEISSLEDYVRSTRRLRKALTPLIVELLKRGTDVVLDFQANTREARKWFRALYQESDSDHILHYLEASDETCLSRLHARNDSGLHPYRVSDADFATFTRQFVPPVEDEAFQLAVHEQE